MKSVVDRVDIKIVQSLAIPSNIRLGEEIIRTGKISFMIASDFKVVAVVKPSSGSSRVVELQSTNDTLEWKCACTSNKKLFCKHLVAVSLSIKDGLPQ